MSLWVSRSASLLYQCDEMHLKGVVVGGHLVQHRPQLLVLFLGALQLGLHGDQLKQSKRRIYASDKQRDGRCRT